MLTLNQDIQEFYVSALLGNIAGLEITSCLGVDISANWEKYQTWILPAREGLLPASRQSSFTDKILSPFAFAQEQLGFRKRPFFIPSQAYSLDKSYLFPDVELELDSGMQGSKVKALLKAFQEEAVKLENSSALLPLMEKYLATIPMDQSGISLYEYTRLSTALALCLYKESQAEYPNDQAFLLLKGDFPGIQEFIFNVVSKGAARSLKGRSYRVQALTHLAIEIVLDRLGLSPANLIYDGGGNFYLLAARSQEQMLRSLSEEISRALLSDELSLLMAWTPFGLEDLEGDFSKIWAAADEALRKSKLQALYFLPVQELFEAEPIPELNPAESKAAEAEAYKIKTQFLAEADGFILKDSEDPDPYFSLMGKEIFLLKESELKEEERDQWTSFNQLEQHVSPFLLAVKDLPSWDTEGRLEAFYAESLSKLNRQDEVSNLEEVEPQEGNLIEFGHLASFASQRTQSGKLCVMKMDLDNMGLFFREGLKDQHKSLAHNSAIALSLKWFFEGHINSLLDQNVRLCLSERWQRDEDKKLHHQLYIDRLENEESFRENLYVVYSGGDDFFVVGAWDLVIEFAWLVYANFRDFTQGKISLSAGLVMVGPSFPVSRFAQLAEEAEKKAKEYDPIRKNRVTVFGEVLSWQDYEEAMKLRNVLYYLIMKEEKAESRAILGKIKRSIYRYSYMQRHIRRKGSLPLKSLWDLMYQFRDVREQNRKTVEKYILFPYEDMLKRALKKQLYANPALFGVAARWAEFLSRTKN